MNTMKEMDGLPSYQVHWCFKFLNSLHQFQTFQDHWKRNEKKTLPFDSAVLVLIFLSICMHYFV